MHKVDNNTPPHASVMNIMVRRKTKRIKLGSRERVCGNQCGLLNVGVRILHNRIGISVSRFLIFIKIDHGMIGHADGATGAIEFLVGFFRRREGPYLELLAETG